LVLSSVLLASDGEEVEAISWWDHPLALIDTRVMSILQEEIPHIVVTVEVHINGNVILMVWVLIRDARCVPKMNE
jgi:hypothetical protein